jgi:hypothetical protein
LHQPVESEIDPYINRPFPPHIQILFTKEITFRNFPLSSGGI